MPPNALRAHEHECPGAQGGVPMQHGGTRAHTRPYGRSSVHPTGTEGRSPLTEHAQSLVHLMGPTSQLVPLIQLKLDAAEHFRIEQERGKGGDGTVGFPP